MRPITRREIVAVVDAGDADAARGEAGQLGAEHEPGAGAAPSRRPYTIVVGRSGGVARSSASSCAAIT